MEFLQDSAKRFKQTADQLQAQIEVGSKLQNYRRKNEKT